MNELISTFPRILAIPDRINCLTKEEFYEKINIYNGVKPKIYFSLYTCNEYGKFLDEYFRVQIDKISFDLDSENCIKNAKKLSDWCLKNNYRHCIIFSTGGLWIHIKTKNFGNLQNPKSALKNSQEFIIKKLNFSCGKNPKTDDIDFHIIGDVARVSRMVGSIDLNRNIYCISIKREDLTTIKYLREKAKKQSNEIFWYCDDAFDISYYDTDTKEEIEIKEYDNQMKVTDKHLKMLPPCLQNVIMNVSLKGHNQHWVWVTIFLKEIGFSSEAIKDLLKPFLEKQSRDDGFGKTEWEHYIRFDKMPESVFRYSYFFPKCEKLYEAGFCLGKCSFYNKLYR